MLSGPEGTCHGKTRLMPWWSTESLLEGLHRPSHPPSGSLPWWSTYSRECQQEIASNEEISSTNAGAYARSKGTGVVKYQWPLRRKDICMSNKTEWFFANPTAEQWSMKCAITRTKVLVVLVRCRYYAYAKFKNTKFQETSWNCESRINHWTLYKNLRCLNKIWSLWKLLLTETSWFLLSGTIVQKTIIAWWNNDCAICTSKVRRNIEQNKTEEFVVLCSIIEEYTCNFQLVTNIPQNSR